MIKGYVINLSEQMGIKLSRITVEEGQRFGCLDVLLVNLSVKGHIISTLIYKTDLECLQNGQSNCYRLELKIRSALSRLQMLLNP